MDREHQEKLSLIKELILLSRVDHGATPLEKNFIIVIAEKMGIFAGEVEKLYFEDVPFTPPQDEFRRIFHFQSLLLMMGIDQRFTQAERDFCRDVGLRMGLNNWSVEQLIENMVENEGKPLPPGEVIKIFKAGYN
ncbi:MAG: hypothetical protein ACOYXB_07945 [Bacteroidota bacterium]